MFKQLQNFWLLWATTGRRLCYWAMLGVVLLIASSHAFAQEATIVGTVTDPSGSVLPAVTITITNTDTGKVTTFATNDAGQYVAPDLAIGHYTIKAEASGFSSAVKEGVVLNVGDRDRLDFAMKVGEVSEKVTVEANPIAVQSDSGEVSSVITGQQVTQLSTNGRSLYSLFALTPGASSVQGDFVMPTAVSGDSNVSINGQRAGHNLQLLDGGENLDRGGSSASVMPSLDAIAEFRNMTSNYSAEYGLSSAATITEVIKSGTKQFHASLGNSIATMLSMRATTSIPHLQVAEFRFNTYGFNVGGPVEFHHSDNPKTFFFYNMEWRSLVQGGTATRRCSSNQHLRRKFRNDCHQCSNSRSALTPARMSGALHRRWSDFWDRLSRTTPFPRTCWMPMRRRFCGWNLPGANQWQRSSTAATILLRLFVKKLPV